MTTQHQIFKRPRLWRLISGLTLAVAALFFILAGFKTAHAAPVCTTSGNQVTCTFNALSLKFSLGGNFGLHIFASGYPAAQPVNCSSHSSTGPLTPITAPGNSSLQYDATTQSYTYVWKTDKAWAGTCRQLIVKLMDGTTHTAFFQFNGKVSGAGVEGEAAVTQQIFLPLVNR